MNPTRSGTRLTILIAAALALSACGKQEAPPPPPPAAAPAPAPAPAPVAPAPAAPAPAAAGTTLESVELGNAVDASGKLTTAPATSFAPKDTIYAVVSTNNAGTAPAAISAHWEFQGGVTVNDSSQQVSAGGPSVTTFHVEKPGGWPVGHYRVVVSIDGKEAATKEYEIK